ncbi:MAG: hypothetical protein H6Q00_2430 [Holophagaceae bacterium]|nr:hypothetical protein [Holophagaceae bacterium]
MVDMKPSRSSGSVASSLGRGRGGAQPTRSDLACAISLPFLAAATQWILWPWVQPFVWFLFYPASFFSARIGRLWGGIASTGISTLLVWYIYMPPGFSWTHKAPSAIFSTIIFLATGAAFSLVHERESRALRTALDQSEARLKLLIDHAPAALAMFDRDMRYLAVSRRWLEEYGITDQNILGRSHYEIFPEIPESWRKIHRRGLAGEIIRSEADRFERQDGQVQWVRWEVRPWSPPGRPPEGIVIFSEDITERIQAQEALQESEARYHGLFLNNHIVILILDPETGAIVDANPAAARFYGWSEVELRGMKIQEINTLPPEEVPQVLARSHSGEQRHFYFKHRLADASLRDVEVFSGSIPLHHKSLLYAVIHDVTEQRQAELESRETHTKLATALASMQDAVFISDTEGRFIEFNDAFATFHKFKNKAECAKTFADYPEILDVFMADGTVAPVCQWAVPRALRGETASNAEYRLRRKDTGETWVGSYSFAPIRNQQGSIVGSVVVGRDITEAKRLEEEVRTLNLNLEKRVQERTAELEAANAELESFSYAVSHDLRAPLRAMGGFSKALEEDLGPRLSDKEKGFLDQIILASSRMSDLIDGILQLSRTTRGGLCRERLDLTALAERVRDDLERIQPERRILWTIEPGLTAWADPRLMEVLLRNLLGNAWKYSAGRQEARIRFGKTGASFAVEDNGAGFDMAHASKLFQPFQRLHRQDEFPGLGIGLATVQRVIHRHGGSIEAHAQPGEGAVFTFSLPDYEEHPT